LVERSSVSAAACEVTEEFASGDADGVDPRPNIPEVEVDKVDKPAVNNQVLSKPIVGGVHLVVAQLD